jgi:hypothetical protein
MEVPTLVCVDLRVFIVSSGPSSHWEVSDGGVRPCNVIGSLERTAAANDDRAVREDPRCCGGSEAGSEGGEARQRVREGSRHFRRCVPGLLQPPRLFCSGVHGPFRDLDTWIVEPPLGEAATMASAAMRAFSFSLSRS